jgi:hypothetical protein
MTESDELVVTLGSVASVLSQLGVRWAIGGSLASAAHGEPRATNDVDIVANLDLASARSFPVLLGPRFYADANMAVEAVRSHGSFNVIDQNTFVKIDVFVPSAGPMGLGQLDRVQILELLPGLAAVPVLGPEDTVLQKLRWYRVGGEVSDRQWRDIVGVLRHTGAALDDAYLEAVAKGARLEELLARARADAVT